MPARAFEARATATLDPDPIAFTVSGREFRCVSMAPAAALEIISGMPPLPAATDPGYYAAVVQWCTRMALFIRGCLQPDQQPEWDAFVGATYLEPDLYADVTTWLADTYRARIETASPAAAAPAAPVNISDLPPAGVDPITARQQQINKAAWDPPPDPAAGLPDGLRAIVEAGGGFTLPGQG